MNSPVPTIVRSSGLSTLGSLKWALKSIPAEAVVS
jgi:hypothetical protein